MSDGELILFSADDGAQLRLRAVGGTVWLTQAEMAELYGTSVPNIAQTIARILADGEVTERTINSELMVRQEGPRTVRREVKIYNLDMVLAVGYRVTSPRAVQFRQWEGEAAMSRLDDLIAEHCPRSASIRHRGIPRRVSADDRHRDHEDHPARLTLRERQRPRRQETARPRQAHRVLRTVCRADLMNHASAPAPIPADVGAATQMGRG